MTTVPVLLPYDGKSLLQFNAFRLINNSKLAQPARLLNPSITVTKETSNANSPVITTATTTTPSILPSDARLRIGGAGSLTNLGSGYYGAVFITEAGATASDGWS